MKTTAADFKIFKKAFVTWQLRLGLTQYDVYFEHVHLRRKYAELDVNQMGKCVTARLNKDPGEGHVSDPAADAKHEAVHLLLSRLSWLGSARYIEDNDIEEEEEAVVMRLCHVM